MCSDTVWCAYLRTLFVVKLEDIVAMLIYICFIVVRHCKEISIKLCRCRGYLAASE